MLIFWRTVGFVAVLLLFDTLFSHLSTCDPASYPNPANQSYGEYCSALRGPFISFLRSILARLEEHSESVIAAFTVVLAISTIALWSATRNLWQAGKEQFGIARQTAEAAQKSAVVAERTLKDYERPWLFIDLDDAIHRPSKNVGAWHIAFTLNNYGRSPAIIDSIHCGINSGTKPDDPLIMLGSIGVLGPGKEQGKFRFSFPEGITPTLKDRIYEFPVAAGEDLFLRIEIAYYDIHNGIHFAGDCWRYDVIEQHWLEYSHGDFARRT
jgi:hypothetical protein